MMVSANRFRSIGWIALLLVCGAVVMVLAFRVNALRSQVHRTELKIVSLRKEKLYLETEVETRANQQQLKLWNDVEFGYVAPSASQYLANERQLAAIAKPDGPGSPEPIRVASADDSVVAEAAFPAVMAGFGGDSEISAPAATPEAKADTKPAAKHTVAADHAAATASLGARLAMVPPLGKGGKDKPARDSREVSAKAALAKPAKAAKGDAAQPARGAKLAAGKPEAKPGKAPAAGKPAQSAKPAKPAKGGKSAP